MEQYNVLFYFAWNQTSPPAISKELCKNRIENKINLQDETGENKGIRARYYLLNISTKGEKQK